MAVTSSTTALMTLGTLTDGAAPSLPAMGIVANGPAALLRVPTSARNTHGTAEVLWQNEIHFHVIILNN